MLGEASAAHCWLGTMETETSTARIGHRAVRGPVDYRLFIQLQSDVMFTKYWEKNSTSHVYDQFSGKTWDLLEPTEAAEKLCKL